VAFLEKVSTFPEKYLGPPLHFCRLCKVDLQPLIDKIVGKLLDWIGKNNMYPGRIALTKSVLIATAVYHATALMATVVYHATARERIPCTNSTCAPATPALSGPSD
jgi:hypothetical protein